MGAVDFTSYSKGKNMKEAYSRAVERAEDEHGNDPYNGTISTTSGFKDLTSEWKRSKLTIEKFINKMIDICGKRECYGVCIDEPVDNPLKIKSQVVNTDEGGTKKWVLKYCIFDDSNAYGDYDTKGAAVKEARKLVERHRRDFQIRVKKKLEKTNPVVAKVLYKKSDKEKSGRYVFFGWAAS